MKKSGEKVRVESDESFENIDLSEAIASRGKVVRPKMKKINIDLPASTVTDLDNIAAQIGISRQPLIKMWIHKMILEQGIDKKAG